MARLPKNLATTLRKHGLKVTSLPGWSTRGHNRRFVPAGVLCHHTASSSDGLAGTNVLRAGRSDLPGPIANLGLSRSGRVYLVAAGHAYHAGTAKSSGTMAAGNGNEIYIGIEAMNRGTGEKWNKKQYDAYVLLCAVLSVEVTGNSHNTVRAHKETSVTGKIDPFGPTPYERSFDMGKFRSRVAAKMKALKGGAKPAPSKPAAYDKMDPRSYFGGVKGAHVSWLMGRLITHGITHANDKTLSTKTTQWGPTAVAAVAAFQAKHKGWAVSGVPGPMTLAALAKDPAKPKTKTLSVMTWNVEDKNDGEADVKALAKLLAEHKPDVVCIQEGYDLYLGGIPGYREVYHASKGYPRNSENRGQAILVRDGVAVKVKRPIEMALSWRGPKMGVKKQPRVHRYVTVNKDKTNWRVSTWHVPFGTKPVEETRKAAISWLKKMGALGPAVAVGDWNALANGLPAKVAKPAHAVADGGGLDRAVFRGCKKVKGENFGKQGRSDHNAKMWTFRK